LIQWPVLLPHASALAKPFTTTDNFLCLEFNMLSGSLDLSAESTRLTLELPTSAQKFVLSRASRNGVLQTGERAELCSEVAINSVELLV